MKVMHTLHQTNLCEFFFNLNFLLTNGSNDIHFHINTKNNNSKNEY